MRQWCQAMYHQVHNLDPIVHPAWVKGCPDNWPVCKILAFLDDWGWGTDELDLEANKSQEVTQQWDDMFAPVHTEEAPKEGSQPLEGTLTLQGCLDIRSKLQENRVPKQQQDMNATGAS
ncbi:unnamed protein product [Calypogeia fissa]